MSEKAGFKQVAVELLLESLLKNGSICIEATGRSMGPLYRQAQRWVVRPCPIERLKAGDVVAFRSGEETIGVHRLHRIQKPSDDPRSWVLIAKGDANREYDPPFQAEAVIGKAEPKARSALERTLFRLSEKLILLLSIRAPSACRALLRNPMFAPAIRLKRSIVGNQLDAGAWIKELSLLPSHAERRLARVRSARLESKLRILIPRSHLVEIDPRLRYEELHALWDIVMDSPKSRDAEWWRRAPSAWPGLIVSGIERNGMLLGFTLLLPTGERGGLSRSIEAIGVHPDQRRKKAATRMLHSIDGDIAVCARGLAFEGLGLEAHSAAVELLFKAGFSNPVFSEELAIDAAEWAGQPRPNASGLEVLEAGSGSYSIRRDGVGIARISIDALSRRNGSPSAFRKLDSLEAVIPGQAGAGSVFYEISTLEVDRSALDPSSLSFALREVIARLDRPRGILLDSGKVDPALLDRAPWVRLRRNMRVRRA